MQNKNSSRKMKIVQPHNFSTVLLKITTKYCSDQEVLTHQLSGFEKTLYVPHLPPRFCPSPASPISILSFLPPSLPFPQHPMIDSDFVRSDQIFYAIYVRAKDRGQSRLVTFEDIVNLKKIVPSVVRIYFISCMQLDDF